MAKRTIHVDTAAELVAALEIRGVAINCPAPLAKEFGFALIEHVGTDADLDAATIGDAPAEEGF